MDILSADGRDKDLICGYDIRTTTKQDLLEVVVSMKLSTQIDNPLLKKVIDFLLEKFHNMGDGKVMDDNNYLAELDLKQEDLVNQKFLGVNESVLGYILKIESCNEGFYDFCKGVLNNLIYGINTERLKFSEWEYKPLSKVSLKKIPHNDNTPPKDGGRFNFHLQDI